MHLIGRRDFLAAMGLGAGSPLLGCIFDRLLPEAMGAVNPGRKRFLMFTHGGSLLEQDYTCVVRSPTDFDLTPVLAPLQPYKQDLIVLSKFYVPFDKRLHGNQYAVLSMMASSNQNYGEPYGRPPGGISFDRFLANQIGGKDAFSSIAQGLHDGKNPAACLSADGQNKEFPAIGNPIEAYDRYFGNGVPGGSTQDTQALLAQDRSVLDAVRGDIARMSSKLATPERAKLDQYLESLRGLERQLGELAKGQTTCEKPAKPTTSSDRISVATVDAHLSVQFAAHLCGLTRVSHFSLHGYGSPHHAYSWLGDTTGYHLCHHNSNRAMILKIETWVMTKVAELAGRLAKTAEGNGSMLDNSLLMFLNTCGGKHHNGSDTYSIQTLGRAGGALRTGRYLSYGIGAHSLADPYVAFANALDVPIKTFGNPAHCKGPLPGLL